MGTTCANIHIWKANEADVRPHIGISHTLSSFSDHWISILSDDLITDGPYVARRLSRSIDQPVLFVSL